MADKKAKADPKKAKVEEVKKKAKRAKPTAAFTPVKFKEFEITQKRSGRFEVTTKGGKNVNGVEKEKVLQESKVVTKPARKASKEEPATT